MARVHLQDLHVNKSIMRVSAPKAAKEPQNEPLGLLSQSAVGCRAVHGSWGPHTPFLPGINGPRPGAYLQRCCRYHVVPECYPHMHLAPGQCKGAPGQVLQGKVTPGRHRDEALHLPIVHRSRQRSFGSTFQFIRRSATVAWKRGRAKVRASEEAETPHKGIRQSPSAKCCN